VARTIAQRLAEDGFEAMGSFVVADTIAVGDPARLAASAAFGPDGLGNAWEFAAVPGEWLVWLHVDAELERVVEVLLVSPDALGDLYAAYDGATEVAVLGTPSGRVAIVEASRRDDTQLLKDFLEPEELPWLVDDGIVASAGDTGRVRVLAALDRGRVELVSVHLGPFVVSVAGSAPIDSDERD
jgi:hypothetical protein